MHIGTKIKEARMSARLTQEQAAEALGVSRQTVSNWENNKTYPDIVSVIRMSDLYAVSLDRLLKDGAGPSVSAYIEYLAENTDMVKSKQKLSKIILVTAYLVIWALALVMYWAFTSASDAMGYSIVFQWVLLPVTTFVISFLIGKGDFWGKKKWFAVVCFAMMHMLAEYATFSMANMVSDAFAHINMPDVWMLFAGAAVSTVGIGIGALFAHRKGDRN